MAQLNHRVAVFCGRDCRSWALTWYVRDVLIRLSPAELLTLADTAGFYLPSSIKSATGSGRTLRLDVSTHGSVPGIPNMMRAILPATISVELDFLEFRDGVATFQSRVDGPIGAFLPMAAKALVEDLLAGNDLPPQAISVDSAGVFRIDPEAMLAHMPLPGGITLSKAAVEQGEIVLHAAVR